MQGCPYVGHPDPARYNIEDSLLQQDSAMRYTTFVCCVHLHKRYLPKLQMHPCSTRAAWDGIDNDGACSGCTCLTCGVCPGKAPHASGVALNPTRQGQLTVMEP